MWISYLPSGTAGPDGGAAGGEGDGKAEPGRSRIEVGARLDDDRIASVRLVAIKQAAKTAVARVSRLAVPRVVIMPPIVLPPPMPSAPPSLRCNSTTATSAIARSRCTISTTWIIGCLP